MVEEWLENGSRSFTTRGAPESSRRQIFAVSDSHGCRLRSALASTLEHDGTLHSSCGRELPLSAQFDENADCGEEQEHDLRSEFEGGLGCRAVDNETEEPCRSHKPDNDSDQNKTPEKSPRRKH